MFTVSYLIMNGEIPSVPITTLAGISSLSDLLPEMPLPSPLPQAMGNKSLLFHPRVAEEANNLLSLKDDSLVLQLAQSLSQTSAINIELKDNYSVSESNSLNQEAMPELLKSILMRDPGVFDAATTNSETWSAPGLVQGVCNTSVITPVVDDKSVVGHEFKYSPLNNAESKLLNEIHKDLLLDQKDKTDKFFGNLLTPSSSKVNAGASSSGLVKPNEDHKVKSLSPSTHLVKTEVTNVVQKTFNSDSKTPEIVKDKPTNKTPIPVPSLFTPTSSNTPPRPLLHVDRIQNDFSSKIAECLMNQGVIKRNADSSEKEEDKSKIETEDKTKNDSIDGGDYDNSKLDKLNCNAFVKLEKLPILDQASMKSLIKGLSDKSKNPTNSQIEESSDSEDEAPKSRRKIFKSREKERALQKKKEIEERSDKRKTRVSARSVTEDKVKEIDESEDEDSESSTQTPKHKYRKVEKKLVPVLEKLSVDELMETNTYQRFNKSIERIFEDVEDVDITADIGEDGDCPSEALISKYQLQDLCSEAAKLNSLGALESIPSGKLIKLLTILERNIRDGAKVSPISDPNDDEEERKLFMELAMDRVMRAVDASLTALYILTAPNMHKQVYLEDVIDRIIIFTKFQLHNTIYPSYDPVYRVQNKDKDGFVTPGRKKRGNAKEVREKNVLTLYTKLTEVVSLLGELMNIQKLTDNSVLHASSMGISPFFVERVSDLQLAALKLVTTIFAKYEKHRKLLLDDILASMARLPSSKRSLRSYRVSSEDYIQMLTALVLQLVQCMVQIPHNLSLKQQDTTVDPDIVIVSKFKAARSTASNFLYVFLAKCSSKSEEIDYRPLFENFVQDLLTTVNKPEWPAAELMLSVLGNLLVNNFVNKSLEMPLRVASLDYLGVVAARLRKDSVTSHLKVSTIDQIIRDIKVGEMKDEDGHYKGDIKPVKDEDERTQFLQRVLLDYLAIRGQTETVLNHARHFYIAQWYQDICNPSSVPAMPSTPSKKPKKPKKKSRRKIESSDEDEDSSEHEEEKKEENPLANLKVNETKKLFFLTKVKPFTDERDGKKIQILQTYVDYSSAELITRYLASKRPFSQSFDVYLKHILKVLTETSVLIRTKAMKCLTSIVEVDPSVLGLKEMQLGVSHSFLDHSTSVREAAVDLVGKFILSRPELIPKYYDMLSARILDTGVSVRKRVIKILKDVCTECPTFPKIPEICVKIIRRVNDEDGIRKLVLEVFQNMWFTPVKEKPTLDAESLVRKVMNITDAVSATNDMNMEWFEQLLLSLFKPKDDAKEETNKGPVEVPKTILDACRQIVDCLIETVVRLDGQGDDSQKLVSCMLLLYLFAKIRPQLLVHHATVLQPYLSLKCKTQGDYQIISCVARTLELVVPLIEHPSEMFLARLEEDSVKLMMQQDPSVVLSCVSCLGSIVNNVTRNFPLIRDCLKKYHGFLTNYKNLMESGTCTPEYAVRYRPSFRRSLFVVGLLLRFFDFTDPEVIGDLAPSIKDDVFQTFLFFLYNEQDSQHYTLKAVGSVCIRHYELMLQNDMKSLYRSYLSDIDAPLPMKIQVLNNIENYLQEEERKMIKQDLEWAKMAKQENLKEMGDVTSGMASTVIQVFLKDTLEAFIHPSSAVRNAALKVIQLILAQGLVHPVQMVPYLICLSTDDDRTLSVCADKQLQDIEKKYPGFIHMKSQTGIKLSYKLQRILQKADICRGFRLKEGELPAALNGFLYSTLRTKQQRRALALSILKQFDEQVKTSLSQMLYLADNMAYFPYQVQDEPLFIIHHIDIMLSVTGTNLLQSFRESLVPIHHHERAEGLGNEDEEEDEDEDTLLSRIPEDCSALQQCLTASQGCLLLLVLKQHLKTLYGFNDAKITQYSPSESSKIYEKSVNRKSNNKFNPKATIQKLKEGTPPAILDEDGRRAIVNEYLEFKTLIMNLDPDDCDEDDDGGGGKFPTGEGGGVILRVREIIQKKTEESEAASAADGSPPKVPKLTIFATKVDPKSHRHKNRKTERHKKHNHKRKRKVASEDSDDEYDSDPDYYA